MGFFGSFSIKKEIFFPNFNFEDITKKVFYAPSDASKCGLEKNGSTNFAN
jgi:hypothetical protein